MRDKVEQILINNGMNETEALNESTKEILLLFSVSPSLPTDEAFRAAQDEICFYGMAGRESQSKRAIMEAGFEAGYRYAQHRLKGNEG